jgi:hypothetical protein
VPIDVQIARKDVPDAILPEGFVASLAPRLENGAAVLSQRDRGPVIIRFVDGTDRQHALAVVTRLLDDVSPDWRSTFDVTIQ